jgi:DNA-directed RNA polymerase specialized sigma24 family protein
MTNKEAAEYLDTDFELVRSAYHTAKKRMFQMLEYMDRVGKGIIVLNKYETLTDNEKMFILKYIIKLSTSQITELYGGKFTESSVNNRTFRFRNKCLKQMVAA